MMNIKPMNHREYQRALDALGISQVVAGRLFGVGARTSRRWASEETEKIPQAVAILLRLMVDRKLKLEVPMMNEETRQLDHHKVFTLTSSSKLERPQ